MQPSRFDNPCFVTAAIILAVAFIAAPSAPAHAQACFGVVPEIDLVQPDPSPPGSFVTIIGAWFQPPPCLEDVLIGGVSSPAVAWLNYHTILAQVPPSLGDGVHDVEVVIDFGGTSSPYPLEVLSSAPGCNASAVATISEVVPGMAPPLAQVEVLGTSFEPLDCLEDVRFGGVSSPAYAWTSHESIIAVVPDGAPAGLVNVEVQQNGLTTTYPGFEVLGSVCLAALPQIDAIVPPTAPPGAAVMITGQLFQPPPCLERVSFDDVTSPLHAWIDGHTILATVPPLPGGARPARVHVDVGGTSNPFDFDVVGCTGDANADLKVDIDDIVAVILGWNTSEILPDVDGSGLVDIDDIVLVVLSFGADCAPCPGETPVVTGVDAPEIGAGQMVTISGNGFEEAPCLAAVIFDGLESPVFARIDDQTIVAVVPEIPDGSTDPTSELVVVQSGGSSAPVALDVFFCLAVRPNIHDASPLTAAPGDDVTLYGGASFQGPPCLIEVTFNLVPSPAFSYDQATGSITATVPPVNPGPALIMVHCHVGGTSEPYYYFISTPIP